MMENDFSEIVKDIDKNREDLIKIIDRVWNECFQGAIANNTINPWNYGHPYHNNYQIVTKIEYGTSMMIMEEISSGEEIFRVIVWYHGGLVGVQGILTYKEEEDSLYKMDEELSPIFGS